MSSGFDPYHKWLGIPPKDQPPHHYRLLGIELLESDPDAIENAADQRMRHVRSFQNGPHQAQSQKLLNEIASAKVCLLDAKQKARYDERFAQAEEELRLVPDARETAAASAPVFSATSVSSGAARSSRTARQKNPVQELIKIVAGGIAGIAIGLIVLGFLREDWDMLGIAKAVRGSSKPAADDPLNNGPPVTPPPVTPPPMTPPPVTPPGKTKDPDKKPKDDKKTTPAVPIKKLSPLVGEVEVSRFTWNPGDGELNLGPAKEGFFTFSWIAGYFLGNGEWLNITINEEQQVALRGGGVKGVHATATRVRSPYRAWFEDEVKTFQWEKGKAPIQLIHEHDGFAVLSQVQGCFLDEQQAVEVYLNQDDGYWYLNGRTNVHSGGHAQVYRFKQPGKFRAKVTQIEWPGSEQEARIPVIDGLCFISAISGRFMGHGENLNAMVGEDGKWRVWGSTQQPTTSGKFIQIEFNTPEMLAFSPVKPNLTLTIAKPAVVEPPPVVEAPKGPPPAEADIATAREKLGEKLSEKDPLKLLSAASEVQPNPERYALLTAALEAAIAAGDCTAAQRVIDRTAEKFEIDTFPLTTTTLQKLRETATTAAANRTLANAAMQHFDLAVKNGNKEALLPLAELGVSAARKAEDPDLNRRATLKLIEARK